MTPLAARIPAKYRNAAYLIFALVGVALGSVPVYCAAADTGVPSWIVGALAVYAFVGTALGFTASANTPASVRGLYLERD